MKKITAFTLAFILALTLTACSSKDNGQTTTSPTPSAGQSASPSPSITPDPGNDSMEGGGAGGTNDTNNDGKPDADADHSGQPENSDNLLDDAGEAVEDGLDKAGRAVRRAAAASTTPFPTIPTRSPSRRPIWATPGASNGSMSTI